MIKITGVGRLGRDAELRTLATGTRVCNLSVATQWGKRNADGVRPTQWVDAQLYGPIAESLHQYLKKGTMVFIDGRDVRVETYEKRNGEQGMKLAVTLDHVQLIGLGINGHDKKQDSRIDDEDDGVPF